MTRITRHSASVALEMLPSGVLVVRLAGPLTGEALQHFKREIVARHGPDIRAYVADYARATIALTGAELDAVLEGEAEDSPPTMPAAMVVPDSLIGPFRGHAARMAGRAIVRRLFPELAPALAWATRQAELAIR